MCWNGFDVCKEVAKHEGLLPCRSANKAVPSALDGLSSYLMCQVHGMEGLPRSQRAFEGLQDFLHELLVVCCILSSHLLPLLSSLHSVHLWHCWHKRVLRDTCVRSWQVST